MSSFTCQFSAIYIAATVALLYSSIGRGVNGCFPLQQPFSYPSTYTYSAPSSYGSAPYAASKSRMASDTHTFVDNSLDDALSGGDSQKECVQRRPEAALSCAVPFERRTPSTEPECHRVCADNALCRSFVYDANEMVCELFDLDPPNNLDHQLPERMAMPPSPFAADDPIPEKRHRRFAPTNGVPSDPSHRRTIMSGGQTALLGPLQLPSHFSSAMNCEPSIIGARGKVFVALLADCDPSSTSSSPFSAPQPTFLGAMEPFTSAPSRVGFGANTIEVLPSSSSDCPNEAGSRARIQLIDGISLVEERPIANVQLQSADACLHACRMNTHLDGTRFAKPCRAATFDKNTGRCEIINDAISPNGELNYVPNPDSIYFEKFCIPESELPAGCDDIVHRIPQHTLDSRAAGTGAVVSAQSQTECIRRCITAQKRLGFECASASFYFDWTTDNCYLSRFTRANRPDIYVAERRKLVDYLELAPCMRRAWQHDDASVSSTWSSWSNCDENSLTRSRRRNCTNCANKVEIQTEPCINKAAMMKEFPSMLNEEDTKILAPTLEDARRFKPSSTKAFGEYDTNDEEEEVPFFGPPHQSGMSQKSTTIKAEIAGQQCDPHKQCCPQPTDLSLLTRGCSIGYRILDDGKQVPCLPDSCQ